MVFLGDALLEYLGKYHLDVLEGVVQVLLGLPLALFDCDHPVCEGREWRGKVLARIRWVRPWGGGYEPLFLCRAKVRGKPLNAVVRVMYVA